MAVAELELEQLDLFADDRWPRRPYCSDDLAQGLKIRSLKQAVKHAYIQANPPYLRVWSLHDLDYPGAALAWEDALLPPPSWTAMNRENGHAHLCYGLVAPVLVDGMGARDAPMRYLCAVESMMREKLRADPGFSGLVTKNPAHPLWRVLRGPAVAYELSDLAEWLPGLEKHRPKRRSPEEIGLGRNVALFDRARKWAYGQVLRYKAQGGLQAWNGWLAATNFQALSYNGDFHHPLDGREVWWIAKSVAKWTWRNFSPEGRHEWAVAKGRAGGVAKGKANEDKRASARMMAASGKASRDIAAELGVNQSTVVRWLKG